VGSVRLSWAVAASLVALGGVVAAAAPASARQAGPAPAVPHATALAADGTPATTRAGLRAVAAVPRSAESLGRLPGATWLHLVVTLKVRDPAGLTAFISALSDRQSPLFHHFLRPVSSAPGSAPRRRRFPVSMRRCVRRG
jgi:hypothetical protein